MDTGSPRRPRADRLAGGAPDGSRSLRTLVVDDADELAPHLAAWDALAVQRRRPFCAPGWMLSWWSARAAAGARGELRVVLVLDDEQLVGVGPFFVEVERLRLARYRLLGADFCHGIGPLAQTGREEQVAAALARALAGGSPAPAIVSFDGVTLRDPLPELIAASWPGRRARLRTERAMDQPTIELGGDYDAWMARRERKFRKEARRTGRRLEEAGVTRRLGHDAEAVDLLLALHHARREELGGSYVDGTARTMLAAALSQLDPARIAIALLEGPDGPVAADLVLSAGDVVACWNGGFDPGWASYAPGTQSLLFALESCAALGTARAELGGGGASYKRRLADGDDPIAWRTLLPPGARYPLASLRLVPTDARALARRALGRLGPQREARLRKLLGRIRDDE